MKAHAQTLLQMVLDVGVTHAARLRQEDIVYNRMFRSLCEQNTCGNYGKCYMCPPDAGDIDQLIAAAKQYDQGIMYQTISQLEDSFDFEGMQEAGKRLNDCSQRILKALQNEDHADYLLLTSGGCRVCDACAKQENLPCRYPQLALSSLETYGIDVYNTSRQTPMKYINGANTVTFFGMLLFGRKADA